MGQARSCESSRAQELCILPKQIPWAEKTYKTCTTETNYSQVKVLTFTHNQNRSFRDSQLEYRHTLEKNRNNFFQLNYLHPSSCGPNIPPYGYQQTFPSTPSFTPSSFSSYMSESRLKGLLQPSHVIYTLFKKLCWQDLLWPKHFSKVITKFSPPPYSLSHLPFLLVDVLELKIYYELSQVIYNACPFFISCACLGTVGLY